MTPDHIVQLVESLVWPLTLALLLLFFRKDLQALVARVSRVRYREAEIELSQLRDRIDEDRARLIEPSKESTPTGGYYDRRLEELLRLSETEPRAAVLAAYIELERAVVLAARRNGIDSEGRINRILQELSSQRLMPADYLDVVDELRRLRNQAAHGHSFDLGGRVAEEFVDLAINVAVLITSLSGGTLPAEKP